MKIPKFLLYGEDDPKVESNIQPQLALRNWVNLSDEEKQIAFQQLKNSGWVESYSREILQVFGNARTETLNMEKASEQVPSFLIFGYN